MTYTQFGRIALEKITYDQLEAMLRNPNIPDEQIRPYLTGSRVDNRPFDPRVVPNRELVKMDEAAQFRVESAIGWGNAVCRWRRHRRFEVRRALGESLPVLVSEGDSWFQFPFLIDDVIDQLGDNYLIWSLDAAGDTAQNMVVANPEYMRGLEDRVGDGVAAFLFSAAGNDVIGEDNTGKPVLTTLLKNYIPGGSASAHIDMARLANVLTFLEQSYRLVIATIRSDARFAALPIIIHGYDYAIPAGEAGDARDPVYAAKDEWLGGPMGTKGIVDPTLRRGIVRFLIDALYDMLFRVAGNSANTRVYVVDVRGTLPQITDWADEIHGTSAGFAKVAQRFRATLRAAGVASP